MEAEEYGAHIVAAADVLDERERQKSIEGWTEAHDDCYTDNSLGQAAACYAMFTPQQNFWPMSWSISWFKPKDRRRNLVRAGALIIAEIERLDRRQRLDTHIAAIDAKHPTAARRHFAAPQPPASPSQEGRMREALELSRPLIQDEHDRTSSQRFKERTRVVLAAIDAALAHDGLADKVGQRKGTV